MDIKKIALFAAGTLFGSAGFKVLSTPRPPLPCCA